MPKTAIEIRTLWPTYGQMKNNARYPIINTGIYRYICVIKAISDDVHRCLFFFERDGYPEIMRICMFEMAKETAMRMFSLPTIIKPL